MVNLIRGPEVDARSRFFDSAGWNEYQPRLDDIIITTYPKCGTTWTQRIVGMLVFQSAAPFPIQESSPWPDFRFPPPGAMLELAESQTHRRFFKSHVPYDSLPIYEGAKIIHVARDGRDAAMSFYNHKINFTDDAINDATRILMEDPKFGMPYQRIESDPALHFHNWILGEADHLGDPTCGFWYMENSYWAARDEPNVLLVHYADMKNDLGEEMRRIASFLEIDIPESLWPALVEAASFDAMKSMANELMPTAGDIFQGGGDTFLHKGVNGRWRDVFKPEDLALYDEKVKGEFSTELSQWIESGRLG
jgi:aryl sulfotransferase